MFICCQILALTVSLTDVLNAAVQYSYIFL